MGAVFFMPARLGSAGGRQAMQVLSLRHGMVRGLLRAGRYVIVLACINMVLAVYILWLPLMRELAAKLTEGEMLSYSNRCRYICGLFFLLWQKKYSQQLSAGCEEAKDGVFVVIAADGVHHGGGEEVGFVFIACV